MADRIIIKDMKFNAFHGVYPEEKLKGQEFRIDAFLEADLHQAGISDKLENSVDYTMVYTLIKTIVENNKFNLLETLAEEICRSILSRFSSVSRVDIGITKPEAAKICKCGLVGIEMSRSRQDADMK